MPRVRAGAFAAAVLGLVVGGALPAARAVAAGESYPRILRVDTSRPGQVALDVVVPPLLAGLALPTDAFRLVENRRPLSATSATRLSPADLRVLLVLDTGVDAATLAAEQGAARDFVFQLPPEAEVAVVAPDPQPDVVSRPSTDRADTIRAIVGLRPTGAGTADDTAGAIELALSQLPTQQGAGVVVAVDSRPVATAVPAAVTAAVNARRVTVYAVVLADPAPGYLGGLVTRSGGRVLQVPGTDRMLSSYDVVVHELLGRYRVVFPAPPAGTSTAELVVSTTGITAATPFRVATTAVPTGPTKPSAHFEGSTRKRTSSTSTRLLAGLLLTVLLARLAWRVVRRGD